MGLSIKYSKGFFMILLKKYMNSYRFQNTLSVLWTTPCRFLMVTNNSHLLFHHSTKRYHPQNLNYSQINPTIIIKNPNCHTLHVPETSINYKSSSSLLGFPIIFSTIKEKLEKASKNPRTQNKINIFTGFWL